MDSVSSDDCPWSNEDNLRFRLRQYATSYLNQSDFYSIGGGEYYDWINGNDERKIADICASIKKDLVTRGASFNKKMNKRRISDQVEMVFTGTDFMGYT